MLYWALLASLTSLTPLTPLTLTKHSNDTDTD
jgi:hypothetical protein